ncbi:MAG TPA: tRNA lysidine(34) synthetase TilS, partial [Polyangia bacterium]|nr:tRNA lysidine(34) synthetase TilS [Polyangia bacterium]
LEVATVDHGLRREAAAEQALVAERAEALGLVCHRLPVSVRPGGGRGGVQEAARDARLDALARLAAARACDRVALGHQADDQAETILFRIIRGTDAKGLAGIPYRRDPFVRPLLDVTRAQILSYLRRRSLPYVLDPSNADLRYARARVRHTLLPLLRQENPRVDEALRRLALIPSPPEPRPAGDVHIPARLASRVRAAAARGGTHSFAVKGGRRLTVSYGRVALAPAAVEATPSTPPAEVSIDGPGRFALDPRTAVVVRAFGRRLGGMDEGAACFDADQLAWPLVLRRRRAGDRMHPRGGRGSRKLSDLLIDAKVARDARSSLPVVTDARGELLFVPGLRPSRLAAPGTNTWRWVALREAVGAIPPVASADD